MRKISKRSTAIAAAVVIATGGAGAAWAAWNLTGAGNTSAKASTASALVFADAGAEGLSPGASTDLKFVVTNNNKFQVRITGLSIDHVDVTAPNATSKDSCTASDLDTTFSLPGNLNVGAAGASAFQTTLSIPNAIKMKSSAGNGCQGATFALALSGQAVTTAS